MFVDWLEMQEIQWVYVDNFWREGLISWEVTNVFMAYSDQTSWRKNNLGSIIWCRFLILLVESCSKLVISVTEHLVEVVDKLSTTAVVFFRSERILRILSMLSKHIRSHISAMHCSILSDLKKATAVVESLSTTSTRCSVTEITSLLQNLGSIFLTVWSGTVLWILSHSVFFSKPYRTIISFSLMT